LVNQAWLAAYVLIDAPSPAAGLLCCCILKREVGEGATYKASAQRNATLSVHCLARTPLASGRYLGTHRDFFYGTALAKAPQHRTFVLLTDNAVVSSCL
jgi:hypothetical protein